MANPVTVGVSSETVKNFLIEAGAVYKNYGVDGSTKVLLGATRGGSTFKIEREYREVEADGAKGSVKGMKRIVSEVATITVRLIEITTDNIKAALPGTTSSTAAGYDTIISTGKITDADYISDIALVGEISGTANPFIGIIKNALADGGLELSTQDKGEGVIEVTFKAHYDPDNLGAVPWEIRNPVRP